MSSSKKRRAYRPDLARHAGLLEQSFRANFVVTEKLGTEWLIAFGDLLGDDALGNKRPPIHSLLVYVSRRGGSPSRRKISLELNDQGNRCDEQAIERFDLGRGTLRIRLKPRTALWSGRVS